MAISRKHWGLRSLPSVTCAENFVAMAIFVLAPNPETPRAEIGHEWLNQKTIAS